MTMVEQVGSVLSKLQVMAEYRQIEVPTVAGVREQLPELAGVSDAVVSSKLLDLVTVAATRERCAGCNGYETCWRLGDQAGRRETLHVTTDRIDVASDFCDPYRAHVARSRHEQMLLHSGISTSGRKYTFDNFPVVQRENHSELFKRMKNFANTYKRGAAKGFYLQGPPGIGKTHLMFATVNLLLDRGIETVTIRAESLVDKLRAAQFEHEMNSLTAYYGTVPVLAIDEFSQGRAKSEFAADKMLAIIDMRHSAQLPTLFASNVEAWNVFDGLPNLREVKALQSRIGQHAVIGEMDGVDYRLSQAEVLSPRKGGSQ